MGEVQIVSCRRSNRLKKEPVVEQYSNPKQFLDGIDSVDIPMKLSLVLGSGNEENLSKLMDYTSSSKIDATELISDRFTGESHTSWTANKSHNIKRRKCFSDVNYIDDTGDNLDNVSGGKSAVDHAKTCTGNLADDLLCSNCQIGVGNNFLLQCTSSSCSSAFHSFCLLPPIDKIEEDWLCPCCVGRSFTGKLGQNRSLIVKKVESVVGHRRNILGNEHNTFQDLFLVKWQSFSHHHDSWVPFEWLIMVDRVRIRTYMKKYPLLNEDDTVDHRKPEWFRIDRVIACRNKHNSDEFCEPADTREAEKGSNDIEFLVKWMGLDYCFSTWESSHTEELLAEVGKFIERHQRAIHRIDDLCHDSTKEVSNNTSNDVYGGTLYAYQIHGLNWILDSFKARKNVILADEMGLGKTVQVVSFVHCLKQWKLNANPILIIAPKSILFQWDKEFRYWAKDLNVIIYQGSKQSRLFIQKYEMYTSGEKILFDTLITNYERLILDSSFLKKITWSAIIIDEAHKIKNHFCKLSRCLSRYTSDFRLLLTGTPLQNTLVELFALLHFIDPDQFSDPIAEAEAFSSIECNMASSNSQLKIAQIHEILKPRMLRRLKSEVLPGAIPAKKWVEVPCSLTDGQRELYINILMKNHQELNKEIKTGKKIVLNFILMELKKCCNHPYIFPGQESYCSSKEACFSSLVASSGKLQLLAKLLPKLKGRGNRVLLFSQMTRMLDILEDFLTFMEFSYFRIDGSTSITERQQQVMDYNKAGSEIFLFLISTRAGGSGVDLPTADRVILYDPDFNPFMDLQAQSRAHRIGQNRPVVVYQLITKCTVEEKILHTSKKKLAIENLVMNPSKKPNADELQSILLHGSRTILNRKNVDATLICYDDNAIDDLLKLDPAPGDRCDADESGYLGSIQSFNPDSTAIPSTNMAKEWENIFGPVPEKIMDEEFGRGKRKKKVVKIECEDHSDGDEPYSPEGSTSSSSSDDDDYEYDYHVLN